jgi:hypothetical protein
MDPIRLLEALSAARAEVVLVGGLAAVLHGSSIVTQDIDLCYRRDEDACRLLLVALRPFEPEIFPRRSEPIPLEPQLLMTHRMLHLHTSAGRVDLLSEVPGLGRYEDFVGAAEAVRLGNGDIAALSLDQLIASKTAMGRPKDRDHLDVLEELRRRTGS